MRARDGFTLPEVLIASLVGFIVLAATMGLLESTLRLSSGVMAKTDAMQRGRLAMDRITQQLRSQVCRDFSTPAIVEGRADSVTFYADFDAELGVPDRRVLSMHPVTGNITETVYAEDGTEGRANLVLENAAVQPGRPFLRYYAYAASGTPREASQVLPVPLSAANRARVARVAVAFVSRPTGARDSRDGVHLNDQVMVRHADPNLSVPDPTCE